MPLLPLFWPFLATFSPFFAVFMTLFWHNFLSFFHLFLPKIQNLLILLQEKLNLHHNHLELLQLVHKIPRHDEIQACKYFAFFGVSFKIFAIFSSDFDDRIGHNVADAVPDDQFVRVVDVLHHRAEIDSEIRNSADRPRRRGKADRL